MDLILGISYSLLSFLALATMSALVKAASPSIPTEVIVFFQNALSFLIILPFTLSQSVKHLRTTRFKLHFLRAITGTAAWYGLFLAITQIPLTNAVLLTYSAPLWIPIIAWLIQGEFASKKTWLSIIIGFIGIALVLHPSPGMFQWGSIYALAAGIFLAVALLTVSWLRTTERTTSILFYYFLLSSFLFLPLALYHWHIPSFLEWGYMVGISLALVLSQFFIILAYKKASAVTLSPLIYSVILFTALISWIFWHNIPNLLESVGMALVIIGGIMTMLHEKLDKNRSQ